MFTHECILRNVGERKMYVILELTKRGYSPMYMNFENNIGGNNIVCEGQTWHCTDSDNKPYCVDCGENINLFLAIASLRDDNAKYQWFTDDNIEDSCKSAVDTLSNDFKFTAEDLLADDWVNIDEL